LALSTWSLPRRADGVQLPDRAERDRAPVRGQTRAEIRDRLGHRGARERARDAGIDPVVGAPGASMVCVFGALLGVAVIVQALARRAGALAAG
jgi:hypothetical protein